MTNIEEMLSFKLRQNGYM